MTVNNMVSKGSNLSQCNSKEKSRRGYSPTPAHTNSKTRQCVKKNHSHCHTTLIKMGIVFEGFQPYCTLNLSSKYLQRGLGERKMSSLSVLVNMLL